MSTQPATEPRTGVKPGDTHLPLFKVLLHNDDVNTMEHVVIALIKVFRFNETRAVQIMLDAHSKGIALCAIEPLEQAELHRDQLLSSSLLATIEPE